MADRPLLDDELGRRRFWRESLDAHGGDRAGVIASASQALALREARIASLEGVEVENVKLRSLLKRMPEWIDVDYAPHVVCAGGCEAHPEDHPDGGHNTGCEYADLMGRPIYPPVERESDDA